MREKRDEANLGPSLPSAAGFKYPIGKLILITVFHSMVRVISKSNII